VQETKDFVVKYPTPVPQKLLLAFPATKESNDKLKLKKNESSSSLLP